MNELTILMIKIALPILGIILAISWLIIKEFSSREEHSSRKITQAMGISIIFIIILLGFFALFFRSLDFLGWFKIYIPIGLAFCLPVVSLIYIVLFLINFKKNKSIDNKIFITAIALLLIAITMYLNKDIVWRIYECGSNTQCHNFYKNPPSTGFKRPDASKKVEEISEKEELKISPVQQKITEQNQTSNEKKFEQEIKNNNTEMKCIDSDGGKNYYVRGKTSIANVTANYISPSGSRKGDVYGENANECLIPVNKNSNSIISYDCCFKAGESAQLNESYCDEKGNITSIGYKCPKGCKDGVCIK